MNNDYECPRCHNIFPNSNKVVHDIRCTIENPMPLDQSRLIQLNPQNDHQIDKMVKINDNEKENNQRIKIIHLKKRPENEELPPYQDQQHNQGSNPVEPKNLSQSGEFPEIFVCDICHETLPLSDKNDHIFCHKLQKMENNSINNGNNLRVSQRTIEQQKKIEKQIKRENQVRRQMEILRHNHQNQRQRENDMNRNQYNSDMQFLGGMPVFHNHNERIIDIRTGPDGRTIARPLSRGGSGNINNLAGNMMNAMGMFRNSSGNRRRQYIPFNMFHNNNNNFGIFLGQFIQRMRNHEHPTDQHILNELPETQIDDVTKLDSEKKNCVICLEDFKNGDKATILPCIHLFHTNCIQNWLKSQNCCPICKFKLTGENLNSQH